MEEILNGRETAEFLHSNYFNVMRKSKASEIPSFQFGGKVLFRRSAIEKWIESQEKGQQVIEPIIYEKISKVTE